MNELLVDRLKNARAESGLKQQEVAEKLGIKANTISNWEQGRTEPDIDTFVKLCNIYQIDCSSLLADVYAFKRIGSDISLTEYNHIKKYRFISTHSPDGASVVDTVLDREYAIAAQLKEQTKYIEKLELLNSSNNFIDPYADLPDTLEELEEQQYESSLPDIEHHAG